MSILLLTRPQEPAAFAAALATALPGETVWTDAAGIDPDAVEAVIAWRLHTDTYARYRNLRLVCATAAGVEKVLPPPALRGRIRVMRVVDPMVNLGMAQYVLAMALRHVRALPLFETQQRQRAWIRHRPPEPYSLTAAVLGMGEAGRAIAALLHAAGFQVAGWSRTGRKVEHIETYAGSAGLEACLSRADLLVCALPLTPETTGLLDRRTLGMLPAGAYVINVARGGHLVEEDLVALVSTGAIAGAALDVQGTEPLPEDSPLWDQPGITITPHIAAQAGVDTVVAQFASNWQRYRAGAPLANLVDPSLGY